MLFFSFLFFFFLLSLLLVLYSCMVDARIKVCVTKARKMVINNTKKWECKEISTYMRRRDKMRSQKHQSGLEMISVT